MPFATRTIPFIVEYKKPDEKVEAVEFHTYETAHHLKLELRRLGIKAELYPQETREDDLR